MDQVITLNKLLTEQECQKIIKICDSKIEKKNLIFDLYYPFEKEFRYVHPINQRFIRKHKDNYNNDQVKFTMLMYLFL